MGGTQLVGSIIGVLAILFLAYYVTYYIGIKASGRTKIRGIGRNVRVLERFSISKDKSFCLIEINGTVYVIGITNSSMTVIDTMPLESIEESMAANEGQAFPLGVPGGALGQKFVSGMASFLAGNKMRRQGGSSAFSESMKNAYKDAHGKDFANGSGEDNGRENGYPDDRGDRDEEK